MAFANGNPVERVRKDFQQRGEQLPGVGNLILQANLFRVSFDTARKLKLPHDYQYDNGRPQQNVDPLALWGDIPGWGPGQATFWKNVTPSSQRMSAWAPPRVIREPIFCQPGCHPCLYPTLPLDWRV